MPGYGKLEKHSDAEAGRLLEKHLDAELGCSLENA